MSSLILLTLMDWLDLCCWSFIVFGCARPPDALDQALPLTSWFCMLNFSWLFLSLVCQNWFVDFCLILNWLVSFVSARPLDALDLALPMTFHVWIVSLLTCSILLDLFLGHVWLKSLDLFLSLLSRFALWMLTWHCGLSLLLLLHGEHGDWGGVLDLGYLIPQVQPFFTLNPLDLSCFYWIDFPRGSHPEGDEPP